MHQNTAVGVNDTLQCSYGVWHGLLYLDGFDAVGSATGGQLARKKIPLHHSTKVLLRGPGFTWSDNVWKNRLVTLHA